MRKTLTALAAALTLIVATVAAPQDAEARRRGGNVAGAIIGGLAVGALFGAAAANADNRIYYAPRRYHYRDCWWEEGRHWNGYRWRYQRVRVCD
jgi:hypothetical protein